MLRIEATIRRDKRIPSSITGTTADSVSPEVKSYHGDQFAMWLHESLISAATNWSSDVLVSWAWPSFSCGPFSSCGFRTVRLIRKYSQYYRLIVSLLRLCSYRPVVWI